MNYVNFIDKNGNIFSVANNTSYTSFLVKDLTARIIRDFSIDEFKEIISNKSVKTSFYLYALYDNETIKQDLTDYLLSKGSLSINYNCGMRRKLSISIFNAKNWKANPFDGFLWKGSKFKFEISIKTTLAEYIFPAGVFILKDFEFPHKYKNNEINLELVDKFGGLDGTVGGKIADSIYIPKGSDIVQVVKSLLKTEKIEGVPYDVKTPIFPSWIYGATTPYTITESSESTIGSLIIKLMSLVNLDVFYDEYGRMCTEEMQENMLINYNPILWAFSENDGLYSSHSNKVDLQSVENIIVVEGANINGDIISARVENTNPKSPTNITIFEPKIKKVVDENISTIGDALLRANYELFKSSVIPISSSFSTTTIPMLDVNKVIAIDDDYCGLKNTKFLINSINISITETPKMDMTINNLEEVTF